MEKRFLSLDLGEKRVGVAVSDPLKIFAQGLDVLHIRGRSDLLNKLSKYFNIYDIQSVVIGNPLNKYGEESTATMKTKKTAELIEHHFNTKVILWDERFSTKEAEMALRELNAKKQKSKLDMISAQIILQSYLEWLRNERHD
ncbi:MAG: Holliday junction resolvase RuvX [Candidatus Saelkia tenebricola]|nr:Holliday junction resolvase RuvX [Candidatus Saelkia tenebricola]